MSAKIIPEKPAERLELDLSVSKIKTFKDCAAKFRFSYIEKLPRKEWEHHIFGTFLHEILETFHKSILDGSTEPYNVLMTKCFKQSAENIKDKLTVSNKDEAWNILKTYLIHLNDAKKNGVEPNVLSVEKSFYIDIDGKILLNGFIDRVQKDWDGIIHVADYKTTKNKKYLKNDWFQLQTYAFVLFLEDQSLQKVRASYILLRHNFDLITKEFNRSDMVDVEKSFLEYAELIMNEKLYRPKPTKLCDFCDYLDICKEGKEYSELIGFKKNGYGLKPW